MGAFSTGRRRSRPWLRAGAAVIGGAMLLTAAFAPVSLAAAPNPSPGSATVDGATGDWSLAADFFADMTAGGNASAEVRGKLYLKYDCDSETLFALVLAQGGEKVRQDRPDEAYVAIDGSKLIHPDGSFAWVNGDGTLADGWEGSGGLAPGSYTLRAHVLVADDSEDGYTPLDTVGRNVPLVIDCGAVQPTEGTPTPTPKPPTAPTEQPTQPGGGGGGGGGVAPTTAARPAARTLPPTDTADVAATAQPGTAGLVLALAGLGALSGVILVVSHGRRKPVEVAVEEAIKRR
jgi:hypothetical protein